MSRVKSSRVLTLHLPAPPPYGLATVPLPLRPNLQHSDSTGRKVYPSAAVLLSAAIDGAFTVADRNVLELGSGAHGAVGRVLRQWWPSCSVTQTDTGGILQTLREGETDVCAVAELDWLDPSGVAGLKVSPDLVVGSDIVYNPQLMRPLCDTLGALLSRYECEVWIAAEERDTESFSSFENQAIQQGLRVDFSHPTQAAWERAAEWIRVESSIGTMTSCVDGSLVPPRERMWLVRVSADDASRSGDLKMKR